MKKNYLAVTKTVEALEERKSEASL